MNSKDKLLRSYTDDLVKDLETIELKKFAEELCKYDIISKLVWSNFCSLDPDQDRLKPELRVRYLLQEILKKVCEDYIFVKFLEVLDPISQQPGKKCLWHAYRGLSEGRMKGEQSSVTGSLQAESDRYFSQGDILYLMEKLGSISDRWEEISIFLDLPRNVVKECGTSGSNMIKLNRVVTWVCTNQAATRNSLKEALTFIGEKCLAETITEPMPPEPKRPRLEDNSQPSAPTIWRQSVKAEVKYRSSTLLEVQVYSSSSVSYQWLKDGKEISDNDIYQGTKSSILLVCKASRSKEGNYVCRVNNELCSRGIFLKVEHSNTTEYLHDFYSKLEEIPRDSWSIKGTEMSLELEQVNEDDILKQKISYLEAFGRYEKGAVMLIEGHPDSGKTKFAQKIAKDWAMKKGILKGAKSVFLVSLRVLNRKGSTLSELLRIFYSKREDADNIASSLESEEGVGVVFIFDGLEEYQSYHNNIDKQVVEWNLKEAMIILFSRPVDSAQLRHATRLARRRIRILDLRKDEMYSYIDRYFQDSDKAKELKEYLKLHISVLHMCYLPVHTAMICYIYSQNEGIIPTTKTKIYEYFTILIIRNVLPNVKNSTLFTILQSLDSKLQERFHQICQLAFETTTNSKQAFDARKLKDSSGSDGPSLGLVTVDSITELYNFNDLYAFLHFTFQEYLTAFHISQLDEEKQLKTVREHQNNKSMLVVWKFYCGMMSLEYKTFHDQLLLIFGAEKVDTLYRVHCAFESQKAKVCDAVLDYDQPGSLTFKNNYFTPGDYNAISYVISTASIPTSKLSFYSCRLDKDGIQHFLMVVINDRLESVKTLLFHCRKDTPDQFKALNLLLSKMQKLEVLDLSETTLSNDAIKTLTNNISLSSLKVLKIQMPFISCSNYYEMLSLLKFKSRVLEEVQYSCYGETKSDSWCTSHLKSAFSCTITNSSDSTSRVADLSNQEISMLSVESLFLHCTTFIFINCGIDDNAITLLAEGLKSVVKLVLNYNRISSKGAIALAKGSQLLGSLQHLSANCNFIDDEGAKALASVLDKNTTLVHLDLECNRLGDGGAVAIARAVKDLKLTLYLWNANITDTGAAEVLDCVSSVNICSPACCGFDGVDVENTKSFIRALQCCRTLTKVIVDSRQAFNKIAVEALFNHLKTFPYLRCLKLSYFNEAIIVALANRLKYYNNLQTLDVSRNNIGLKGAEALADGLKFCTNLQSLNVSGNKIGPEGAVALADGLKSCNKLQTLDVSGNNIGSDGVAVLADGLCSRLQTLKIYLNRVSSEDAVGLANEYKSCNIVSRLCDDIVS